MGYSDGLDVRCERKKSLRAWQNGISYLRWEGYQRSGEDRDRGLGD